jgi:hypothetical protein
MCQFRLLIATLLLVAASAFTPITTAPAVTTTRATSLHMMDVSGVPDIASTGLILAEAEPWVQPLSLVLDPFLNLFSFAMVSFAWMHAAARLCRWTVFVKSLHLTPIPLLF